ncbi:hypothetical protein MPER_14478, partial [Moniliophthora perniciosa FA553]
LTTEVTFVSGDSHYTAPLLPKGEIMNGVAGLLDSDVYRTRPHALELWGPYYNKEELEMDLLGGASIPDPNKPHPKHKRKKGARSRSKSHARDDFSSNGHGNGMAFPSSGPDTEDEAAYRDAAT